MLDCAIIGGGPAGLTAGLYATRGGLKKVTMYEKGMPGGQITQSSEIENYPGVVGDISGLDLMMPWPQQCQKFGLVHEMAEVIKVSKKDDAFLIERSDGVIDRAATVIVCTGSTPKRAGFDGEDEFYGRGVSSCATCDGFFYKDKEVAVIGGGNTALEEALHLSKICSKVYIVHRRDTFRAAPSTIERVLECNNIEIIINATVSEVYGDNSGVLGLKVNSDKGVVDLPTTGVFVLVGHNVNNSVLSIGSDNFLCNMSTNGQVVVDLNMRTNIDGLYAAGDLRIEAPKQVVCAASDGAIAALGAIDYLLKR